MVELCVGLGTNLHLNVRRTMLGIVTAARDAAAPGTRVIWTACSGEQPTTGALMGEHFNSHT